MRAYATVLFLVVNLAALPVLAVRAFARGFAKARKLHGLRH